MEKEFNRNQPGENNLKVKEPKDSTPKVHLRNGNTADWQLTLVNGSNPIPAGYIPPLLPVGGVHYFDERAAGSLFEMLSAAKAEGLSPVICSSYRTMEKQTILYHKQVEKQRGKGFTYHEAKEVAKTVVAYPGTSEHQLGLAVDIVPKGYQVLDKKQADTPEMKWLIHNCSKYGFILRYPLGKSDLTGVIYEPWHFRYVGKEAAAIIMNQGICLEEYLNLSI